MDENQEFGRLLRRLRRERDITREALAELVNCAVPTLTKIEQGTRRPSRELAALLANALRLDPIEHAEFIKSTRPAIHCAYHVTARRAARGSSAP